MRLSTMKILIISPGKGYGDLAGAIAEYEKRLGNKFNLEWSLPAAGSVDEEARGILKTIKDSDYVVLLDERGKDTDTPTFAKLLDTHLQSGTKRLVFVVGGAYGVGSDVKERANATLKLSSLVFPHILVRLVLVEQIYRAQSILEGGKYHHA